MTITIDLVAHRYSMISTPVFFVFSWELHFATQDRPSTFPSAYSRQQSAPASVLCQSTLSTSFCFHSRDFPRLSHLIPSLFPSSLHCPPFPSPAPLSVTLSFHL